MAQLAALLRRAGAWRDGERAWAAWSAGGLPGAPTRGEAAIDPTRLARDARQADGTSCGSAVLTMLAAMGDPALASWLVTGRLVGAEADRPPELVAADPRALARLADAPARARFAAVQRVYRRRATSGSLLGLPWPSSLGTPPWGAARVARFPGVTYGHHPLDDSAGPALVAVLDGVGRAVDAGVPVPLFTGGDTRRGWSTAVPRHVVLAVGRSPGGGLLVFEPAQGRVMPVTRAELVAGRDRQPAFGGWSHLVWALVPRVG